LISNHCSPPSHDSFLYSEKKQSRREATLGKPNFQFKKRQKELARLKKKEEKRRAKLEKKAVTPEEETDPLIEQENEDA
jgi:hypothetical protein